MPRSLPAAREARFKTKVLSAYAGFELPTLLAVRADASGGSEMLIYDEIGYWGITAKDVVLALDTVQPGPLTVRINSPGGDAFDGVAIYNALKSHSGPVNIVVDGLAASAASIIAMAGASITMNKASMMMIHNCWGFCCGNRIDMRATADVQEKIDSTMAAIYAVQMSKRGVGGSNVQALMDAETWFTADEAKAAGLADTVADPAPTSSNGKALSILSRSGIVSSQATLPAYDPDGDGDNDAVEALSIINAAQKLLGDAAAALTGTGADDADEIDDGSKGAVIVPGAEAPASPQAAETTPETDAVEDENRMSEQSARLRRLRLAEADNF